MYCIVLLHRVKILVHVKRLSFYPPCCTLWLQDNGSSGSESAALIDMMRRELEEIRANMVGESSLKGQLADALDRLRKAQAELERSKQASRATDLPRLSPSKFNRYLLV